MLILSLELVVVSRNSEKIGHALKTSKKFPIIKTSAHMLNRCTKQHRSNNE